MIYLRSALIAGACAAIASSSAARADELSDLTAQVEFLTRRMASLETVAAGIPLLAISRGESTLIPDLPPSPPDVFTEGHEASFITLLPTADDQGGTAISWSGYVRSALIASGHSERASARYSFPTGTRLKAKVSTRSDDDWDVKARGQLRVVASSETSAGDVGVGLAMRVDFDGNGFDEVYMQSAWGYWAMTPALILGGGYANSLGKLDYGYSGACTCYYTDDADVNFDPGDTTQLRLSYSSGPLVLALALEDSGLNDGEGDDSRMLQKTFLFEGDPAIAGVIEDHYNGQQLGVAAQMKFSGDAFSAELGGVYRDLNSSDYNHVVITPAGEHYRYDANIDALWQVGAGVSFAPSGFASLSLAAALGEGPYERVNSDGDIYLSRDIHNSWWGVSALAAASLSDAFHAEAGMGYKNRDLDGFKTSWLTYSALREDTWSVLGGLYYTPVEQLTLGLEGEWDRQANQGTIKGRTDTLAEGYKLSATAEQDSWTVDLVSVWRF